MTFGWAPGTISTGPGVGGYFTISTLTLKEALNDPGYLEIAQGIRDRLVELVRDYIDLGVIDAQELL